MKTYHQSTRAKIISCLAQTLFLAMFFVLFTFIFSERWLQIYFGVFILLGLAISLSIIWFIGEAITVSPEGIKYREGYRRINVKWEGFSHIGKFLFREGLFVKNGYSLMVKDSSALAREVHSNISTCFFIPLSPFHDDWHNSELGQQIREYAPHLFQDSM